MTRHHTALLIPLFLSLSAPVQGLRFYVNPDTSKGDDRRSVAAAQDTASPFLTITHALEIAHLVEEGRPHVIEFPPGAYSPSTGETFPLIITQPNIFLKKSGTAEAVFDGEGNTNFFSIENVSSEFVIQGFRFLNGSAERGGVAFCQSCSLRVTDNRFTNNSASEGGQLIYVSDGRLRFFNNEIPSGGQIPGVPLVEIHNTFADTSQRDQIRNNTFYNNSVPLISTSGNRTDINSNIFMEQSAPAILDLSSTADPLIRFNMFWETLTFFVSDKADTIDLVLTTTTIDTLTAEETGLVVPSFVLNVPDTLMTLGETYDFFIDVGDLRSFFTFTPLTLPSGVSFDDVETEGQIVWTPTEADTGRSLVVVSIEDPFGLIDTLDYPLHVFTAESFPDTADLGPVIVTTVTNEPDTSGAIDAINAIVPVFSNAASAGANLFVDPQFLKATSSNFALVVGSPAIDSGDSTIAVQDRPGEPNDRGSKGGPDNDGPPTEGGFAELVITTLPDSIAVEGQTYTYDPAVDPEKLVLFVDYVQGPASFEDALGGSPPINWVPALADTGSYLVGLISSTSQGEGRHFFHLRVKPANEPPVVSSSPILQANEDELYTYTIVAADPNEDLFTFAVLSGPDSLTVDASGLVQWTPVQAEVGDVLVEIRLEDPKGAGTTHRFTLQVANTNDAPVISSEAPGGPITEDLPFEYALTASDPDPGETLVYILQTGPETATVDSLGVLRWTPPQADVGVNDITLAVLDGEGVTTTQTFTLEVVEVDDPPIFSSEPDTVAFEDSLYRYTIQATDEEGGGVNLVLDAPTTGLTLMDSVLEWVPAVADTGVHTVTVTATDSSSLSAIQTFSIAVQPVNDAPAILSRDPVDSLVLADAGQGVVLTVTAEDEEGDEIGVAWSVNGALQGSATGFSFTHTPTTDAVDTVSLTLTDASDTTTTSWVVDTRQIPRAEISDVVAAFGATTLGTTATLELQISNPGRGDLEISSLQVTDLQFLAIFGATPVSQGGQTTLELRFTPTKRGMSEDFISFSTSDPDREQIEIQVSGTGVVPSQIGLDLDPESGSQDAITSSAGLGDLVSLAVYVTEAVDLVGFRLDLSFDADVLMFDSFATSGEEEGNLFTATGISLLQNAVEGAGIVQIDVTTPEGSDGVNGDGLLGIASFLVADETDALTAAIGLDLAVLQSSGGVAADTLGQGLSATLDILHLVGDFNLDGRVDILDFFLFADQFGTDNALFDLDNSGLVNLSDFFIFSENFGSGLGKVPVAQRQALRELGLSPSPTSGAADVLEVDLIRRDGDAVRGYVMELEYDPRVLRLREFKQSDIPYAIQTWLDGKKSGRTTLLAGGGGTATPMGTGVKVGVVGFDRLTREATSIRIASGALQGARHGELRSLRTAGVEIPALPTGYVFYPAYPNPFNPATTLRFFLPSAGPVDLKVFDLAGRSVRILSGASTHAGFHQVVWDGRDGDGRQVGTGVYLVAMETGDFREVRKVMLVK